MRNAVVLFSFAFFPRAQRGGDGQSPNQNLEKFSSFEFLNIFTGELDGFEMVSNCAGKHRNTSIDQ